MTNKTKKTTAARNSKAGNTAFASNKAMPRNKRVFINVSIIKL